MGRMLKILGIVLLVGAAGFAAILFWSHGKGGAVQETFFRAVLSGETARVRELFHPELAAQIDDPVLAAWMAAVKTHLGAFQGLAKTEFSTSVKTTARGELVESKGRVDFEKGSAHSELQMLDGKITAWKVDSDALPANWFTQLEDRALYEQRARAFLEAVLQADAQAALGAMHAKLRAQFAESEFGPALERVKARFGAVAGMTLLTSEFAAGPPQEVRIRYQVDGANEDAVGRVRFVFDGMRAQVVGFDMPED